MAPGKNVELQYFPSGNLGEAEVLRESARKHYSECLAAFDEPSFWRLSEDSRAECYRFLWLRTFHPAICVRIDITSKGTSELTKKTGTGECGFGGVGRLTLNKTGWLTKNETGKFLAQLDVYKIWDEPALEERNGLDGARWIFEGIKGGKYHVVDRWSPEKGPVRKIGLAMMTKLAKLKLLYDEVY